MQKLKTARDMGRIAEAGADVFAGARKATIERVDVHIVVIDHIAADHGALIEVDIVQIVDQPRGIIQILRGAVPILQSDRIDDMDRSASGAIMHIGPGQMQVVLGIAGIQGEVARGHRQHILDQSARKPDPPVIAQNRPRPGQDFNP